MAFDKAKFLARFVEEAKEHIKNLNEGVLRLENDPQNMDTLNDVFRSAHTIKGSSRMMKLISISELAHKLEDALDAFRQNKIRPSKEFSDLLLKAIESLNNMLDQVSAGNDITEAPDNICSALEKAANGNIEMMNAECRMRNDERNDGCRTKEMMDDECKIMKKDIHHSSFIIQHSHQTIRISAEKLDELIKLMGEIVSGHSRSKQKLIDIRNIEKAAKKFLESIAVPKKIYNEDNIKAAKDLYSRLKQFVSGFKEDVNIQGLLTGDLQDRSLKMRMFPLSTIFDTFSLTVRNLSKEAGKDVDFIIEGGETEIDKKIIEKIGDPLLHMIRNSIDHGIETPEKRQQAGKPATGIIRLTAEYEGENVLITLSDDGAGIPIEKIREKAVQKKIFDKADQDKISEPELINLIFRAGFSSSEIITDTSGRGVGMDVAKKNIIEDLKGSIQVKTENGKGTTFYIRLPLTMAVINVLFVSASGMTFAVPVNYIDEIAKANASNIIEVMSRKAIRLRDQIIPIVPLSAILKLPASENSAPKNDFLILITSLGNENIGLIIDSLIGQEDMVIKPLPHHMKNNPFISGSIISGRNEIFNVLHMPKIMDEAKELKICQPKQTEQKTRAINILIVEDSISTREIEKSILESYGYLVDIAGDGEEALAMTSNFQYDLIVTDIEMPKMDGFKFTKHLKEDTAYKNIPVILLTSLDKEEDRKQGIKAGADAYIVKGDFEQSFLLETIRNLVG